MAINCCRYCVAPKRYPGCHSHCAEYLAEKSEYDRLKAEYDKKRAIGNEIYSRRSTHVYKALRNHR